MQGARAGRRELLRDAEPVIEATADKEMARAEAELQQARRRLGAWARTSGASQVAVTATTDRKDNVGVAGEPFDLKVTVKNKGKAPLYQLRATTKSDNRLFNERELVFGKIAPGETQDVDHDARLVQDGRDDAEARAARCPRRCASAPTACASMFEEAHGHAPAAGRDPHAPCRRCESPQFAYTVQVADDARGNGDGEVQVGEIVDASTCASRTSARASASRLSRNLRNLSGAGVLLHAGRFQLRS